MREITTKVYNFDELTDEVKDKAVEKFASDYHDDPWENENRDTLTAFEKSFPVKVKDWEYGNRNYINFDSLVDENIEEMTGVRLLKYIINNYGSVLFKRKYLRHMKSGKIVYSKIQTETCCVLTGYYMDDEILQPIYDFLKKPDKTSTFEDILNDCLHCWIGACNRNLEYQNSKEAIIETIEANEYEFDEGGNLV